jgi:pyruvate,orthophosphate dikinase
MVPLVGDKAELDFCTKRLRDVIERTLEERGAAVKFLIGTMIEVPRAALTAERIAETAEFFSFGTNDLTQMTYAFSRDDSGKFLPHYVDKGILPRDPFQTLDTVGVGRLVQIAVDGGRKTRPDIKLGICGEHGGDPASIRFCHDVGLDYVSCSPYRVPIARLAAAQAALSQS